jgi:phosphopantothenoylcysteine decarboxylase/phosphopantothenate--cysteine ligase
MKPPNRILIGITGGIAAYKIPFLVRFLCKDGCDVRVVLTPNARNFIGVETLRTLSGNPVYVDLDARQSSLLYKTDLEHIRLAEWADLFLIAPASANTIAKLAAGIADNLLTTLALSFGEKPLIIAPAMNTAMWRHPATAGNIRTLTERGVTVLPVDEGELACGTEGPGRMLSVEEIAAAVRNASTPRVLAGKKVLISSGPTVEAIDPVRVITNRSSGKMGAALAQAAIDLGADVTVVSGPALAPLPGRAKVIAVRSAAEMQQAMSTHFGSCDLCIMAAAVCDFRPESTADAKIARREKQSLTLKLVSNPDILESLTRAKRNQFVAGFSLETSDDPGRARAKMQAKRCDLMVLNQAHDALDRDRTRATIIYKGKKTEALSEGTKTETARTILMRIAREMELLNG